MSPRWAPSAIRTPISGVRCETAKDRTPWMPIAASRNATNANPASTRTCTERDAVSASMISVIGRTSETGSSGSALPMMPRTAGASCSSGVDAVTTRSLGV